MTTTVSKARVYVIAKTRPAVSKARTYIIGKPVFLIAKVNQYVVTGGPEDALLIAKINQYVVTGPITTDGVKQRRIVNITM